MPDETRVREALVRVLLDAEGMGVSLRQREANTKRLAKELGLRPTALCDTVADALLAQRLVPREAVEVIDACRNPHCHVCRACRAALTEATPRPADAVTEAMRDLLASAIGQAVVSCAHFASRNIPTEAWNVDYAGIIARALAASPAQRSTPGADGAA